MDRTRAVPALPQPRRADSRCGLNRREALKCLFLALPMPGAIVRAARDAFDSERVCFHVYNRELMPPDVLSRKPAGAPGHESRSGIFNIGIPELLLCSTGRRFLDAFPYFWPVDRGELAPVKEAAVLFSADAVRDLKTVEAFRKALESSQPQAAAVLFTLNAATAVFNPQIVDAWRKSNAAELVVFKDPSRPPYLCSLPALQKGFRRPPPIS
jgi:hypothetical protein